MRLDLATLRSSRELCERRSDTFNRMSVSMRFESRAEGEEMPQRKRVDVPGEWVQAAMEEAGVNQVTLAFAAKCGGGQGTVSKWVKNGVSWTTWKGILSVLGLDADWTPPRS